MKEQEENNKYNYKGALEPVHVKVVTFNNYAPDFIFSIKQWNEEGGWKGLISSGAIYLKDVQKVLTGTMNPIDFANLEAWEG